VLALKGTKNDLTVE